METVWKPCKGGPWPDFPPVHPGRFSGQRPWVLQGLCAPSGPCTVHGSRGKTFPSLLGLPHVPGDVCPEAIIEDIRSRAALGPPPLPPQKTNSAHREEPPLGQAFRSLTDRTSKSKHACERTGNCFVQRRLLARRAKG